MDASAGLITTCTLADNYQVTYLQANSATIATAQADKVMNTLGGDQVQADWKGNGLTGKYSAAVSGGSGRLVFTVQDRPILGVLSKTQLRDNSGYTPATLADYELLVRVNQTGTFLGMRAVVPGMTEAGGGSIINVSSVEGLAGSPYLTAYAATKFAVRGMTKCAALELGKHNIRVNSVHPGAIDTDMASDAMGGVAIDMTKVGKRVAGLRRVGTPAEIADLQVFLASDESSYSTGAEFVADGGASATHSLL
ncbi:SDR family NAD(P)-dependent oxidoreductase [Kibdelosporangium lantanae]|uniref:SDR family NAD(P)-dependent oxidoreductase n=1 Tax=Kibdelosporangium lantanae TaxID=1497396 RepID=A0ABW3MIH4_9PSEU